MVWKNTSGRYYLCLDCVFLFALTFLRLLYRNIFHSLINNNLSLLQCVFTSYCLFFFAIYTWKWHIYTIYIQQWVAKIYTISNRQWEAPRRRMKKMKMKIVVVTHEFASLEHKLTTDCCFWCWNLVDRTTYLLSPIRQNRKSREWNRSRE